MTKEEEIRQQAADKGAEVIDWNFQSDIKGLYCGGVIAVSDHLQDSTERTCILAEELGHHLTAVGNILDQKETMNRKQEIRGRAWAYNRLVGLTGIIQAYKAGCRNRFEIAQTLEVSEDMLQEAVDYYHKKYGLCVSVDNYTVYFEPLGVMELV